MKSPVRIYDEHLFHQFGVTELGIPLAHPRVVQGNEGEVSATAGKVTQFFDLGSAEIALSIVNHDVRITYVIRIGKVGLSLQRRSHTKIPKRPLSEGRKASILSLGYDRLGKKVHPIHAVG